MRAGGETVLHPSPDAVIHAGDRVLVFGLPEQVGVFEREAGTEG